jgi:uncharacterized protein YkwD
MGRAIITANVGQGLYKIRPLYNTTALEKELADLQAAETAYSALLVLAVNSRDSLADDVAIARASMNAILQQWLDGIISAMDEEPEPIEPDDPNDPETGLPWDDPDRAQEAPLLALINAARTAASVGTVSRDDDLDAACRIHLRYQGGNGSMGHTGQWRSKPSDRATQQGYYRPEIIYELLAYGEDTPARVMTRWQREPETWANLLADDVTYAGVAHVFARTHPGSYLWAVLLASPKGDPASARVEEDPADDAAEDTDGALDAIKPPSMDSAKPKKLGEAVRLFALAQNKLLAAQREIDRLLSERLQRIARIDELEALQDTLANLEIDCWCVEYNESFTVGQEVSTLEVPGWYVETGTNKVSILYEGTSQQRNVVWTERSINIAPAGSGSYGKLVLADSMSAAAVVYNFAMESGHLKWKPAFRYGILTAVSSSGSTVELNDVYARLMANEYGRKYGRGANEFPLNQGATELVKETITGVRITYLQCGYRVFSVGDEVVVLFTDFDHTKPLIVGFRREPVQCNPQQIGWGQVQ